MIEIYVGPTPMGSLSTAGQRRDDPFRFHRGYAQIDLGGDRVAIASFEYLGVRVVVTDPWVVKELSLVEAAQLDAALMDVFMAALRPSTLEDMMAQSRSAGFQDGEDAVQRRLREVIGV